MPSVLDYLDDESEFDDEALSAQQSEAPGETRALGSVLDYLDMEPEAAPVEGAPTDSGDFTMPDEGPLQTRQEKKAAYDAQEDRTFGEFASDTAKGIFRTSPNMLGKGVIRAIEADLRRSGLNIDEFIDSIGGEGTFKSAADWAASGFEERIREANADKSAPLRLQHERSRQEGVKMDAETKILLANATSKTDKIAIQARALAKGLANYASRPGVVVDDVANQMTELFPLTKGLGMAGRAGNLSGKATTGATAVTLGTLEGGRTGADSYKQLMAMEPQLWEQNPTYQAVREANPDLTHEQAAGVISERISDDVGLIAGGAIGAAGFIPGLNQLTSRITGSTRELAEQAARLNGAQARSPIKSAAVGSLQAAAGEGVEELATEGISKWAQNVAAGQVDPSIAPSDGVARSMGQAFVGGAAVGGPTGGYTGFTNQLAQNNGIVSAEAERFLALERAEEQAKADAEAEVKLQDRLGYEALQKKNLSDDYDLYLGAESDAFAENDQRTEAGQRERLDERMGDLDGEIEADDARQETVDDERSALERMAERHKQRQIDGETEGIEAMLDEQAALEWEMDQEMSERARLLDLIPETEAGMDLSLDRFADSLEQQTTIDFESILSDEMQEPPGSARDRAELQVETEAFNQENPSGTQLGLDLGDAARPGSTDAEIAQARKAIAEGDRPAEMPRPKVPRVRREIDGDLQDVVFDDALGEIIDPAVNFPLVGKETSDAELFLNEPPAIDPKTLPKEEQLEAREKRKDQQDRIKAAKADRGNRTEVLRKINRDAKAAQKQAAKENPLRQARRDAVESVLGEPLANPRSAATPELQQEARQKLKAQREAFNARADVEYEGELAEATAIPEAPASAPTPKRRRKAKPKAEPDTNDDSEWTLEGQPDIEVNEEDQYDTDEDGYLVDEDGNYVYEDLDTEFMPDEPGTIVTPDGKTRRVDTDGTDTGVPDGVKSDRRVDRARRERVAEMNPEQIMEELYSNELTGLPNRRAFDEDVSSAERVVSIDIDSLGSVNDYGSQDAGDALLKNAADALKKVFGTEAYHISGDEFYVLSNEPEADVEAKMLEVRKLMDKQRIKTDKPGSTIYNAQGQRTTGTVVSNVEGGDFTHGKGTSKGEADSAMKVEKAYRDRNKLRDKKSGVIPKRMMNGYTTSSGKPLYARLNKQNKPEFSVRPWSEVDQDSDGAAIPNVADATPAIDTNEGKNDESQSNAEGNDTNVRPTDSSRGNPEDDRGQASERNVEVERVQRDGNEEGQVRVSEPDQIARRQELTRIRSKLKALAKRKSASIVVHDTVADLPEGLAQVVQTGLVSGIRKRALFNTETGVVHIIAEHFDSEADILPVLAHEAVHAGLRAMFGSVGNVNQALYQLMGAQSPKKIKDLARKAGMDMAVYNLDAQDSDFPTAYMLQEIAAHLVENANRAPSRPLKIFSKGLRSMRAMVGLESSPAGTNADLIKLYDLAVQAEKAFERQKPPTVTAVERAEAAVNYASATGGLPPILNGPPRPFTLNLDRKSLGEVDGLKRVSEASLAKVDESADLLVESYLALKQMQDQMKAQGIKIPESQDTYAHTRIHRNVMHSQIEVIDREFVQGIKDIVYNNKLDMGTVNDFAEAMHTVTYNPKMRIKFWSPELNRTTTTKNPSGLADKKAQEIIDSVNADPKANAYLEVQQLIVKLAKHQLQMSLDTGLITKEDFDELMEYPNYVPLRGWAEVQENDELTMKARENIAKQKNMAKPGVAGLNTAGKEFMESMGRNTRAFRPVETLIADSFATVVRGQNNLVGNTFLALVIANPDPRAWQHFTDLNPDTEPTIVRVGPKQKNGKQRKEIRDGNVPMKDRASGYFTTKVDGVVQYIKIRDGRLDNAMRKMDEQQLHAIFVPLALTNRLLSTVFTKLSPAFLFKNATIDPMTAVFKLMTEQEAKDGQVRDKKLVRKTFMNYQQALMALSAEAFPNRPGVLKDANPSEAKEKMRDMMELYKANGGRIGHIASGNPERVVKLMEKEFARTNPLIGNRAEQGRLIGKRGLRYAMEVIEDVNNIGENVIRLAAFSAAVEAGVSPRQSAVMSTDLTVNFTARGSQATFLNAYVLFANASIQGVRNTVTVFATPKTDADGKKSLSTSQKVIGGLSVASVGAILGSMTMMGEDEEGRNRYHDIPRDIRDRAFIIPTGMITGDPNTYFPLWIPYGLNVIKVAAESMMDAIHDETVSIPQAMLSGFYGAVNSFFPIPVAKQSKDATEFGLRTVLPSALDPFLDLGFNNSGFGSPVHAEQSTFQTPEAKSTLGRVNTPETYKNLAKSMNYLGGGTDFQSSWLDTYPESWEYLIKYFGGGAVDFVWNDMILAPYEAIVNDTKYDRKDLPVFGQYAKEVMPYAKQERFYKRRDNLVQIHRRLKQAMIGESDETYAQAQSRVNTDLYYRMYGRSKSVEDQIKVLRDERRRVQLNENLSERQIQDQVIRIEDRMYVIYDRFNKAYTETEADLKQ